MGVVKQAMNAGTVKQILVGLAKKITDIQDAPSPEERQSKLPASLPTIRGGAIMPQRVAEACSQALDDITKMTEPEGMWSRLSVDEVVWDFARSVMDLAPEQPKDGIRAAIEKASERFRQDPSTWVVDILVYGIHVSCAGLTFGKILFLGEDMGKADLAVSFPDFPTGAQIFARMETEAIDDESALLRAYKILDEHLMILNALCSQEVPSLDSSVSIKHHLALVFRLQGRPLQRLDGINPTIWSQSQIPPNGGRSRWSSEGQIGQKNQPDACRSRD
jgi:hypothetical protein